MPPGFCVTTDAFQPIMAEAPSIEDRLDRLSRPKPDDREAIRALSAEIRRSIEGIAIPNDLAAAEDFPTACLLRGPTGHVPEDYKPMNGLGCLLCRLQRRGQPHRRLTVVINRPTITLRSGTPLRQSLAQALV